MQTRYPILFIPVLLLAIYFSYRVSRAGGKSSKEQLKDLLDTEHNAKFVRSKPIDESEFLIPDMSRLPLRSFENGEQALSENDTRLLKYQEMVIQCSKMKMLSFKNITNLELKMKYGYGTFQDIVLYETNYENYVTALSDWAHGLSAQGHTDDALAVVTQAMEFGSDASKNFILLADLYKIKKDKNSLMSLKKMAIEKGGIMKNKIITHIDNILNDMGDSET